MSDDRAYSVERLAAEWQCHQQNVRDLLRTGIMPTFPIGKRGVRVRPDVVRDFQITPAIREMLDKPVKPAWKRPSMPQLAIDIAKAARSPCRRGAAFIYFARCREFVKVGVSQTPLSRVEGIGYGNPFDIDLLKVVAGTYAGEQAVHKLLQPYHHRFEWFRLEPDLLEAIRAVPGTRAHLPVEEDE